MLPDTCWDVNEIQGHQMLFPIWKHQLSVVLPDCVVQEGCRKNHRNPNPNILLAHGPFFHEPSHTPDRRDIYCFQSFWQTWRPSPAAFFWRGDRLGSFRRPSSGFGLYLLSEVLPWMLSQTALAALKNICTAKIMICQRKISPQWHLSRISPIIVTQ